MDGIVQGLSEPLQSTAASRAHFVSQMERVIEALPDRQRIMPATQWLAWLRGNAANFGIKREEIEWTGINEYLALRGQDRLSREDLTDFLRMQRVPLIVTELSGEVWTRVDSGESTKDEARAREWVEQGIDFNYDPVEARYAKYTIPGGANYREVLLNLPRPMQSYDRFVDNLRAKYGQGGLRNLPLTPEERFTLDKLIERGEDATFKTNHWKQENVLLHLRLDDRLDAEGKRVLFVSEVQSDWGQSIARHGFSDPAMPWELFDPMKPDVVIDRFAMQEQAKQAIEHAAAKGRVLACDVGGYRAPKGPYVRKTQAWVSLAVKQAILMAVDGGYEKVAFISGEQAEQLFDIRKEVDVVRYYKSGAGFNVEAFKDGQRVLRQACSNPEALERALGKSLTSMIVDGEGVPCGPTQDGEGQVLEIDKAMILDRGGMKTFYDQIVPQVVADVVHKLGGGPLQSIDLDRRHLYKIGDDGVNFVVTAPDGEVVRRVASERTAQQVIEQQASGSKQMGFDITPALRANVLRGVPMFSQSAVDDDVEMATPLSVREAIARMVRVGADELSEGVGNLVITTSSELLKEAPKLAPQLETDEFKAWFQGSKVTDSNGQPLMLFHGTGAEIDEFCLSKSGWYGEGAYFTDNPELAFEYALNVNEGANIVPVFLALRNPYYYVEPSFLERSDDEEANFGLIRQVMEPQDAERLIAALREADRPEDIKGELRRALQKKGHDGLIVRSSVYPYAREIIAFDPCSIKAAYGNNGEFNPLDPDITRSTTAPILGSNHTQAWHDASTNTTVFLADRIPAGREASVFLHEIVHRHGRAALPEQQFGQLVDQVKAWGDYGQGSTERTIHDAAAARVIASGEVGSRADEELFAYAVEEAVARGVQPSAAAVTGSAEQWLQAVVESIQRVGEKLIGNDLQGLDGQDLVDLAYALAQVERPEHAPVIEQALQEALQGAVPAPQQGLDGDAGPKGP